MLEDRHGDELERRGILYAPDYVINAGGVISGGVAFHGWDTAQVEQKVEAIYDTLLDVFQIAQSERIPTHQAADRLAERILQEARQGVAWAARAKDPANYYLIEISRPQTGTPTFHFYVCRNGKLEWRDSQCIVEKIDQPGDSFHIIFEARGNRFDTRMIIARAPSDKPHLIGIFQDGSFTYGGVGFRGKNQSESLLQAFFVIPLR